MGGWSRSACMNLIALQAACAAADPDGVEDTEVEAPATARWMAEVFAASPDVPVGRILIPGAFNSSSYACDAANGMSPDAPGVVQALFGSEDTPNDDPNRQRVVDWAKTQDRPIAQQLLDGIRFIEINLTLKDGALTTWHSVYGVPVDEVLDDLVAFSVAWPEEAIVLTFGLTLEELSWPLFADALLAPRAGGRSVCDLLYSAPGPVAEATLADLRAAGRPLVWSPDDALRAYLEGRGDCTPSSGGVDRAWSITVSPEGVASTLAASVAARDPQRLLINDFVFSLDGSASVIEQASYIGAHQGVAEASVALGFAGDFPGRLIAEHDTEGNMNVFAGAYYQDTNLVEAAIAANRARWGAAP